MVTDFIFCAICKQLSASNIQMKPPALSPPLPPQQLPGSPRFRGYNWSELKLQRQIKLNALVKCSQSLAVLWVEPGRWAGATFSRLAGHDAPEERSNTKPLGFLIIRRYHWSVLSSISQPRPWPISLHHFWAQQRSSPSCLPPPDPISHSPSDYPALVLNPPPSFPLFSAF